jgi:hypothetical protein
MIAGTGDAAPVQDAAAAEESDVPAGLEAERETCFRDERDFVLGDDAAVAGQREEVSDVGQPRERRDFLA